RSKEDAHDYRYFPDPDLPPLIIAPAWIDRVKAAMPELPAQKRERFEQSMGLTPYDAAQLTMDRATSDYFEALAERLPAGQAKLGANWVLGEVSAALNRDELEIAQSPVKPENLAVLIARIIDGTISNKIARDVFSSMWLGEQNGNP